MKTVSKNCHWLVVEVLIHPYSQNVAIFVPYILFFTVNVMGSNNTPIQSMLFSCYLNIHFSCIFCNTVGVYRSGCIVFIKRRVAFSIYSHTGCKNKSFYFFLYTLINNICSCYKIVFIVIFSYKRRKTFSSVSSEMIYNIRISFIEYMFYVRRTYAIASKKIYFVVYIFFITTRKVIYTNNVVKGSFFYNPIS